MNNAVKSALSDLYSLHKEYDDFASRAPLYYDEATEREIDKYDDKFDAAEERVYNLAQTIGNENEVFAVLSLMHNWSRIPRYLERHAA